MNIELSAADMAALKDKVIDRVSKHLEAELMRQVSQMVSNGELLSEIKNKAASKATGILVEKVEKKIQSDELMKRCIDSVQGRINLKIHNMLEKGIVVKFPSSDAKDVRHD